MRYTAHVLAVALVTASLGGGRETLATNSRGGAERKEKIVITVVYDNYSARPKLRTAWGFACVIRGMDKTILFDTGGRGDILLSNMKAVGIGPDQIDLVVLSHNHGDHTGGLEAVIEQNPDVTVYVPHSFPARFKESVTRVGAEVVEVKKPVEICAGVHSTGEMGTSIKEQGLVLMGKEGAILITGCAHPGITRMIERARAITRKPIHFVMGGFHMSGFTNAQIRSVIDRFKALGVHKAAPCHCSGDRTRLMFEEAFGDKYVAIGVGAELEFARPDQEEKRK